jgi:mercuric ion binding protein
MNRILIVAVVIAGVGAAAWGVSAFSDSNGAITSAQAAAALETKSFKIDKMTCASCPITVKTAMKKVQGVSSVAVDFKTKIATVQFDPERTSTQAIASASENAGYPATLAGAN